MSTRTRLLAGLVAAVLLPAVAGCSGSGPEYAPLRHPFRGATLYQNGDTPAAHWQRAHDAAWLDPITRTPTARWLTGPESLSDLPAVARSAQRSGALLVTVAYNIPDRDCAGPGQGAAGADAYGDWIDDLADALSAVDAVVVLEPDAVAAECFDDDRARMLADAVTTLAGAGHHVYLDAGHPRWHDPDEMARRLSRAGIADAEGFSVNVSNRQSTPDSARWAARLSTLVGDREAIVDTSRNGLAAPPDDQWCNSARQGLGQPPTTDPGLERVAALLWVKYPGESDGTCGGGPPAGEFWPGQARDLIANGPWVPPQARRLAATAPVTT
jgi:endoglucanase